MTYKNRLILAFLSFSTVVGILFISIIEYSVIKTEDYILERYLQNVANTYQTDSKALPGGLGITSYFSDAPDLPDNVKTKKPGLYELDKESDHYLYIKDIPNRDAHLMLELDGTAISDIEQNEVPIFGALLGMAGLLQFFSWLIAIVTAWFMARPVVRLIEDIQASSRTKKKIIWP